MLKIYRASAGSGKTFRLTRDYIRLLFDADTNNHHRRILAVTFTNKATEEMKSRIVKELYILAQGGNSAYHKEFIQTFQLTDESIKAKAKQILKTILHDYSSFSISTIDKFFQQVIRAFARDIGIHGGYFLELDTDEILEQAVDNLFFTLSDKDNKQLLEWLTQYAEERIEDAENWNMRPNILQLGKEVFKEKYQHKAAETNDKMHDRIFLTGYKKKLNNIIKDFSDKTIKIAVEALNIIEQHGLTTDDFKGGSRSGIKNLEKIASGKFVLQTSFLHMMDEARSCYAKDSPPDKQHAIEQAYDNGLQAKMLALKTKLENDIVLYNTAYIIKKHLNTLGILSDLNMQIKQYTTEQNTMLIADSNLFLNKIIDHSDAPFVYEKTGVYIDHYMIDEFQDTSVLQWRNFLPLIKNSLSLGNSNLVVGDVKQSIYRWRNSDWNLLDSHIYDDFNPAEIEEEPLDTNWRSDENIINFNNVFFETAAQLLQDKLNENMGPVLKSLPQLDELRTKITHAYQETKQAVSSNAGKGYVQIHFVDSADSQDHWKKISLQHIPEILEDCQARGYKPGDIAILVRKRNDQQEIIQYLLEYKNSPLAKSGFSYDIMGTEGLRIDSASTIKFLLGVLSLFINPHDEIQKAIVNYEYARGKLKLKEDEAILAGIGHNQMNPTITLLFTEEETNVLKQLKHISLFEMTEQLILLFDLPSWHNEVIFLQAFQDIVFNYSTRKSSDLNSFLQWWSKFGQKQLVSTTENDDAFQIMTIHKSKGLDFKAVIIPFCDWEFDTRMRNILWCETNIAPFNELPLMPVEYNAKLGESVFAEYYFREMMQTFTDNLNVAYVAFTRTKHELFCMSPLPKTTTKNPDETKSLSSLLYNNVTTRLKELFIENNEHANNCFEIGQKSLIICDEKNNQNKQQTLISYPSVIIADRLKIKHNIGLLNRDETDITESPLDYGNLMHEIFSNIHAETDYQKILQDFVRQGRINSHEASEIVSEIADFWKIPETKNWFRKDAMILNETTILTPEGHQYRPDRIILEGKNATVIDYKFGEHELPSYKRQIKNYTSLLNRMGYQTNAYLCYVKLKKVEQII